MCMSTIYVNKIKYDILEAKHYSKYSSQGPNSHYTEKVFTPFFSSFMLSQFHVVSL